MRGCRMMLRSWSLAPLLCVALMAILSFHHAEAQDNSTGDFNCESADLATCQTNGNCSMSLFGAHYVCNCDPGYMNENISCIDIDECSDGTAVCGNNEVCNNTEGGYDCSCDTGYILFGNYCAEAGNCSGVSCSHYGYCDNGTCTCDPGFTGDGVWCTDIDDCLNSPCAQNATCYNNIGSYMCVCDPGFTGDGNSYCLDMCPNNTCASNATCYISHNGTELCVCNDGYSGDGVYSCYDIDECSLYSGSCHPDAYCTNNDGGFDCTCLDGFNGNGTECTDVDECENPYQCKKGEVCFNYIGTHQCACARGYVPTDSGCRKSLVPILIGVNVALWAVLLFVVICACCCCSEMCCGDMQCCKRSNQPKWSKSKTIPRPQYAPRQPQYATQPQYAPRQPQYAPQPQYVPQIQYAQQQQAQPRPQQVQYAPQPQPQPRPQYIQQVQNPQQAQYAPQSVFIPQGQSPAMRVPWNDKPALRMNPNGQGVSGSFGIHFN